MPPPEHAAFFSSSRLTLNVTRRDMAQMGWCPSGRLFEAAACGTAIVSDRWPGIEEFFLPGREILLAETGSDVIAAMSQDDETLKALGEQARARLLAEHSSQHRAREMVSLLAGDVPAGRVRRDSWAVGA